MSEQCQQSMSKGHSKHHVLPRAKSKNQPDFDLILHHYTKILLLNRVNHSTKKKVCHHTMVLHWTIYSKQLFNSLVTLFIQDTNVTDNDLHLQWYYATRLTEMLCSSTAFPNSTHVFDQTTPLAIQSQQRCSSSARAQLRLFSSCNWSNFKYSIDCEEGPLHRFYLTRHFKGFYGTGSNKKQGWLSTHQLLLNDLPLFIFTLFLWHISPKLQTLFYFHDFVDNMALQWFFSPASR